jgi:hypothetical protein
MAKKTDKNVARLVALATELNRKRTKVPVSGSRTYLFRGKKVKLLYTDCPTEETARVAENFNATELAWLAEDLEVNGLEKKARAMCGAK